MVRRDGREAAAADQRDAAPLGVDPRVRLGDRRPGRRAPPRPPGPGARARPAPPRAASREGSSRSPISASSPKRSRPHAASTIASRPRSPRLRRRVSMLPRSGSIERVGSSASSWARRRAEAVPIRIPGPDRVRAAERVARILALGVGADDEALDVRGGHVLRRVHGDVDAALEQRLLELLDEDPAGADLAERARAVAVARRRDRHERDLDAPTARNASAARSAWVSASLLPREPTRSSTAASRGARLAAEEAAPRADAHERGRRLQRQRPPDAHRSRHDCSSSSPNRCRTTSA